MNLEDICTEDCDKEINAINELMHSGQSDEAIKMLVQQHDKSYLGAPEFMTVWNENNYCSIKPTSNDVICKYRADAIDGNGLYRCLYDEMREYK